MSPREEILKRTTHEVVFVFGLMILFSIPQALAHEEGAPFSAAVIDPLVVHHAHLEDEQRLNLSFSKGFKQADGKKRFAFMNEYELACLLRISPGVEKSLFLSRRAEWAATMAWET